MANNTMENRAENSKIPQEQYNNELDYEQRIEHTSTSGEIPPKEQWLENTGSQLGEISPEEQGLEDIEVRPGEIPPKQQQKGKPDLSPQRAGEIPQQRVHQLHAGKPTTTGEGVMINPNGEDGQWESTEMDTAEHYLDDNFSDVMRSSAIGSNVSSLFNTTAFNTTNNEHKVTLDWIILEGRNSHLETLKEKHIMNFPAPGGKTGAMFGTFTGFRAIL